MALVQMNTRIDQAVKRDGDAVFAQIGMTPSDVVRAVWEYAAKHQSAPAIVTQALNEPADAAVALERGYRKAIAESACMLVADYREMVGFPTPDALGDIDYKALKEEAMHERLAERGLA